MSAQTDGAFAELLKGYRLAAGLTQEALAERAGLGVRSIQGLERGENRPARDTLRRLVEALALAEGERARLLAAGTPAPRNLSAGGRPAAPPPRLPVPRHNLPRALTALIGREAEQGEVLALLARAPLVMLTGSGGVGKTRLALAVAGGLINQYRDGVWLVELAPLAEPGQVPGAVAQVLGIREEVGRPLIATLIDHQKDKHLLLLLDNCEHLVAACAALAGALLRACPRLHILATSREALAVAGERRYRVPSLPVPDLAHLPPRESLADSAAVALFLARAQERRADFLLTAQNARAVAQVCARLDGIPLAIELAAARVDSLSVEGIAVRLDDRFRLLTGGARDALPRQRTLRAALDWSYDLLTQTEQVLLARLAVFAGGCTLAAAEAVCAGAGIEDWEMLDLLGGLVNKSLVQAAEVDGEVRYWLLETVRQYGQERLTAVGDLQAVRERHLSWCLALVEEMAPRLQSAEQVRYSAQLERELDNVRAALRWALERGAANDGLQLAGALGYFWLTHGYLGEGRGWLEGAFAVGAEGSAAARASALTAAGHLASWQGDFAVAVDRLERGVALYRALDDTSGVALGLHLLGEAVGRQGDFARATLLAEQALALRRASGDRRGIAYSLHFLGVVAYMRGEYERATALAEESTALFRQVGIRSGVAYSLSWLACAVERRGAYARAVAVQEEALALWQAVGNRLGIAFSLVNLGWARLAQGEEGRAIANFEESLALAREVGAFRSVPDALTNLGWAAYRRGEHERAAALVEQALTRYRHIGYRWGTACLLVALGCVVQARSECGQAATYLKEGLQISHAIGARGLLAEALEGMAWAAAAERQPERAARMGGAAEALRAALGAALHPVLHAGHERAVRAICDALGEEAFAPAWVDGRSLPLEEAVALALEGSAGVSGGE